MGQDIPPAPPEAEVIRLARKATGRTAEDAAAASKAHDPSGRGVGSTYWLDVERGRGGRRGKQVPIRASDRALAAMARAVGVEPHQLTGAGREDAARVLEEILRRESDRPAPPRRARRLKALEDSDEPGLQPFLQGVLRQVYTAAGIISAFPADRDLPDMDQLPELEPVLEQMPGETVFPGSATDPLLWDNPLLSAGERVRLVARVRSMAAKHGGAGQRDRQVSGLAPWRGRGAAGAVPLARYRAGIT